MRVEITKIQKTCIGAYNPLYNKSDELPLHKELVMNTPIKNMALGLLFLVLAGSPVQASGAKSDRPFSHSCESLWNWGEASSTNPKQTSETKEAGGRKSSEDTRRGTTFEIGQHETTLQGAEESTIYVQHWGVAQAKGLVLITPGLGEHSGCYHSLAQKLNQSGWNALSWDLQGHGRSSGARGYIQDFSLFFKNLGIVSQYASKHSPPPPPFLLFFSATPWGV